MNERWVADVFTPLERFYMQAVGNWRRTSHLTPMRAKRYSRRPREPALPWPGLIVSPLATPIPITTQIASGNMSVSLRFEDGDLKDGVLQVDRRAYVYYMAVGNSPAMMAKNIGLGSYYLWTYKDSAGEFLDGAKNYKLHIPPNVPAKDFWSVLVYDSLSRSELQNGQKFPSVSKYTDPRINADGSVDVYFGPGMPPGQEKNWIKTVPGKGWFPIFRFYGPLEPLFDKTWKLSDIEEVK